MNARQDITSPSPSVFAQGISARDLVGKVAVVTGASSGLGARFAQLLLTLGMNVVVTARRADRLAAFADAVGSDCVHSVPGDLNDPAFPAELIQEAIRRFDRLDVMVNNAGITLIGPAESESTEDFSAVLAVNLTSVFTCCREAYRPMVASGGGSIINVGSVLGLVGIGKIPQASYCAAKGGVSSLTRELAAQWAEHGIRVNCIAPGWFPSEMTADMMRDERSQRYIERTVPLRRAGRIDELDGILAFLASEASSYVTGQTIAVDGGWSAV